MSADALRAVLRKMKLTKRLKVATMDSELYSLATSFNDVDSMLIDDMAIYLGGKENSCYSGPISAKLGDHHLDKILAHCPSILSLFVQTKLTIEEIKQLEAKEKTSTLQKLYISHENFGPEARWDDVKFVRLKSLGILQRQNQPIEINPRVGADTLKPVLSPTLHYVVLTGVVLLPSALPALFSLPQLRSLDLIGTLIDSKEGANIIPTLKSPPYLMEVSWPPSLFAFTKGSTVKFDFQWLTASKISLYMEFFHQETIEREIKTMFNKEHLRTLVVYGNYMRCKLSRKMNRLKNVKILYGPADPQVNCPSFATKTASLVSHLVRHSPYTCAEKRTARSESWPFSLETAVEDPPMRQQQRDLGPGLFRQMAMGIGMGRLIPVPPVRRPAAIASPPPPPPVPQMEQLAPALPARAAVTPPRQQPAIQQAEPAEAQVQGQEERLNPEVLNALLDLMFPDRNEPERRI